MTNFFPCAIIHNVEDPVPFIWGYSPILEEGGMVCTSRYTAAHFRWATDMREVAAHPAFTFSQKNIEIFFERKNTMKTTKFSVGRVLVALLLALVMAFSFVACQDDTPDRLAALEQAKADLTKALADVKTVADAAATKTALDAAQAAIAALQTGSATKEELKAATDKLAEVEADLELVATDAEVAAIKTALEATINTAKAALEAKDAEFATAIANLKTSADGVAGLIDTKVAALKTELEGKITALETSTTNLQNAIEELDGKVDTHKAEFDELKAAVEALQATVGSLGDENGEGLVNFVEGYKAATKLLYEVKEDGTPGEYSFAAFEELFNSIKAADYEDATYKKYAASHDELKFYLSRATSVQDVKDIFADLKAAIADLPTLAETLADKIEKIGYLKADEPTAEKIASIKTVYGKMETQGVEIEADLKADYDALLAAYDNLLDADEYLGTTYKANVAALPAVVLLDDSKTAVDAIKAEFATFVSTYFADNAVNAYYYAVPADDAEATDEANAAAKADAAEAYAITLAGEDYTTAKAKIDRYAALDALRGTMVLNDYTAFGVTMLPLYSDSAITDHYATVDAWLDANDLDDELELETPVTHNVYTLLGEDKFVALVKADAYVKAMKNIYTTKVKGESVDLIKAINDIVAVPVLTLTADEQNAKDIREDIDAVEAEIDAVIGAYDPDLDSNFKKMLEAAKTAEFEAQVELRMTQLNAAKLAYADLLAQIKEDVPDLKVVYSDYKEISAHIETSKNYKTNYALAEVHYTEVGATAVDELLAQLVADYNVLIADIKAVYIETKKLLDQLNAGTLLLSQGDDILDLYDALYEIVVTKGVDNIDIALGEVDSEEANLNDLYVGFAKVVTAYGEMAEEAEDAAQAVINLMLSEWGVIAVPDADGNYDTDALEGFAALLQNVEAIDEVLAAFNAWYGEYLGNEVGEASAVLAAIDNIEKYGQSGTTYDFIDFTEWFLIIVMDYESEAAQDAAAAERAAISAMLDAFRANGAIDDKLVTVPAYETITAINDRLVAYYAKYWNDTFKFGDETDAAFSATYETLTAYAHTTVPMTVIDADGMTKDFAQVAVIVTYKLEKAQADRDDIKVLIDAIMALDPTVDYDAIIANTPAILDALEAFYNNYYNGKADNSLFGATAAAGEAYILNFHKQDKQADMYKVYADIAVQLLTDAERNELNAFIPLALRQFNDAKTVAEVEAACSAGSSYATSYLSKVMQGYGATEWRYVTDDPELFDALKNAKAGAWIILAANTDFAAVDASSLNLSANLTVIGQEAVTVAGMNLPAINGLTLKNITFTAPVAAVYVDVTNLTVDACTFEGANLELNSYKAGTYDKTFTNIIVKNSKFDGTGLAANKTAVYLGGNVVGVTVTGNEIVDSAFNAVQMPANVSGKIVITDNKITNTGDRVFRFGTLTTGALVEIKKNTIVSNGDTTEGGTLLKFTTAPVADGIVTIADNTWNDLADADVADKFINAVYVAPVAPVEPAPAA